MNLPRPAQFTPSSEYASVSFPLPDKPAIQRRPFQAKEFTSPLIMELTFVQRFLPILYLNEILGPVVHKNSAKVGIRKLAILVPPDPNRSMAALNHAVPSLLFRISPSVFVTTHCVSVYVTAVIGYKKDRPVQLIPSAL